MFITVVPQKEEGREADGTGDREGPTVIGKKAGYQSEHKEDGEAKSDFYQDRQKQAQGKEGREVPIGEPGNGKIEIRFPAGSSDDDKIDQRPDDIGQQKTFKGPVLGFFDIPGKISGQEYEQGHVEAVDDKKGDVNIGHGVVDIFLYHMAEHHQKNEYSLDIVKIGVPDRRGLFKFCHCHGASFTLVIMITGRELFVH
jgi:hypothetical protein